MRSYPAPLATVTRGWQRIAITVLIVRLLTHACPAFAQTATSYQGRLAFTVGHYVSPPIEVANRQGPSPAFVPRSRNGWQIALELKAVGRPKHGVFGRVSYDKLPMGYDIDARPEDHPEILGVHVVDANLAIRFDRISLGIGYKLIAFSRRHWVVEPSVFLLRNTQSGNRVFNYRAYVIEDTTALQTMRIVARSFPGQSIWQWSVSIGVARVIAQKHAIGLSIFYNRPIDPLIVHGDVVLFGETQYRTTLSFEQSGIIYGAALYYAFGWPKRPKPPPVKEYWD